MSLLQGLMGWWGQRNRCDELVDELITACVSEIRGRLSNQVYVMSHHERRGYVRARAVAVVSRALDSALQGAAIRDSSLSQLRVRVLEGATRAVQYQIASELMRAPVRRAA